MEYRKYWASIQIAIRQQLSQHGQLVGRLFLYFVIVYLFHQVFQSVGAPKERFWYLAVTEWLILSTPPLAFQIAEDIMNGQVVYFILRPMSFLSIRFCECLGTIAVRFVLLGVCCLGLGSQLSYAIPGDLFTWGVGALFGMLSIILYSVLAILIGLCSFWLREIKTLIFLNLTATFCFGGLIVPLDFYSTWVRNLCFWTPYPWILWCPAELITGGKVNIGSAFMGWCVWMLILTVAIYFVYQKCMKSFVVEGG